MNRKNLIIAGGLGVIIILSVVGAFIILPGISEILKGYSTYSDSIFNNSTPETTSQFAQGNAVFNSKTPEEKAIFIARLNEGTQGFRYVEGTNEYFITVDNVSLTSDGKYWIVNMHDDGNGEFYNWAVTIDAKTLMSKGNGGFGQPEGTWRSLDELVAAYIAQLESCAASDFIDGRPSKITMDGKEVWKVHIHYQHEYDPERYWYIYVDVVTGQSKNEDDEFNKAAGTDGWLTLKDVDNVLKKGHNYGPVLFKEGLRDYYPE